MNHIKIAAPYAEMALHYLPEWSPLPITTRDGEKVLLVKGVTGGYEKYADVADVQGWLLEPRLASAGIALRMPKNVIGIDLDCYGDKAGRQTFAELQAKWGRLENTWITSARSDGSGIRLYRIPDEAIPKVDLMRDPRGTLSDGNPLGGMEVIRWRHRYATVWPTWHGGVQAMYRWVTPDGEDSEEWPLPEDLPYLPAAWIDGLCTGQTGYLNPGTAKDIKPSDWFASRPDGEPCEAMQRDLARYKQEVRAGGKSGGCYPAACRGILALVGNATEGHPAGRQVVTELWRTYKKAMAARTSGRRSFDAIGREFTNSLEGAIRGMPATKFSNDDPCEWAA